MIKREPDPATTQKRVVLLHGEIGQDFVTAYVERAQGHGSRCEVLQHLAIDLVLLVLERKGFTQQKVIFSTIQTDTFGTAVSCGNDIGDQPDIRIQWQPTTVWRFGRQVTQRHEPFGSSLLLRQ